MKKKIALLMASCLMLTACSELPKVSQTPTGLPGAVANAVTASAEEVDERIKTVGESYDGLYDYNYDGMQSNSYGLFNHSAVSKSAAATAMPEMAAEAEDSFDYMPEEPGFIYEEPDWNTESYNEVKEAGIVSVQTQPFSTFGADVDTAS